MLIRRIFFIVLFTYFLSCSILAQITTDETTTESPTTEETTTSDEGTTATTATTAITTTTIPTTTTRTACNYPDEFPLFDDDTCISRTAYTAIFLTSIILAGISFLMLLGVLILCCFRRSTGSDTTYVAGKSPNPSPGDQERYIGNGSSPTKTGYVDRSYSAPYTDSEPVSAAVTQKTNKSKPRAPDTYEMESRPRTKTSANPSRSNATKAPAVTNLDDSQRSYSDNRISTNSEPESSYF